MLRLPEPKDFCFCIDLRIGSLIIGVFSLIGSLINILTWISGVRSYQLKHNLNQLYKFDQCDEDCQNFVHLFVQWILIIVLVLDGLHLVMSSLLIHGIRKEKPRLFLPFLSWQITRLIISLGVFIVLVIVFRTHIVYILSFITVIGFIWILDLYFFLVIHAYKMELCRAQGSAPFELSN